MKYLGLLILAWGSCMVAFSLATLVLRLMALQMPEAGVWIRGLVGAGAAWLGVSLYLKGGGKLRGGQE